MILVQALKNLDRLIQIEHERYRHHWLEDGEPRGFFWSPAEVSAPGTLVMPRLPFSWIFRTPLWMTNDPEANNNLKQLRFYVLAWNLGLIGWLLIMLSMV